MRARRSTARTGPRPPSTAALLTAAALLVLCGCASGARSPETSADSAAQRGASARVPLPAASSEEAERQRAARRATQDARAFLMQERPEAALRATGRGLYAWPDDPALLRERARALEALGRSDEAAEARAKADRLDPPPRPLPEDALPGSFDDLLVVIQAPELDLASQRARHEATSAMDLEPALTARLATRLPGAVIAREREASARSVPDARDWLRSHGRQRIVGVHIVRAFCGESVKDGRYAVATIHRTQLGPGPEDDQADQADQVDQESTTQLIDGPLRWSGAPDEHEAERCALAALYRALERWLTEPSFGARGDGEAAAQQAEAPALPRQSVLALMPGLRARVEAEHVSARRALFVGALERALVAYGHAAALDPEDADITSHIVEIEATLVLNRELAQLEAEQRRAAARDARVRSERDAAVIAIERESWLPAELTPAQREALESQLESERRTRDDLLATLATVSGDRRSAHVPEAALRESEIVEPGAIGPRRALALLDASPGAGPAGHPTDFDPAEVKRRLAVKTLHGPTGKLVARYYFDAASLAQTERAEKAEEANGGNPVPPVLVEEDVSANGRLDRWTAYAGGVRTAVWEERREESMPDLHAIYAGDGRALVRLELDDGYDGQPDRVYEYESGVLVRAAHDTNGDGWLDRFDWFDADGRVALREEDVTGDQRIDVRSTFRNGRLVKRELMDAGRPGEE